MAKALLPAAPSPSARPSSTRRRRGCPGRAPLRPAALLRVREDAKPLVSWTQTAQELLLRVNLAGPLEGTVRGDVELKLLPKRLRLALRGAAAPVLEGEFESSVNAAGSYWQLDEDAAGRFLQIALEKRAGATHECLLEADASADAAVTARAFLDVSIDEQPPDRLVLGLFGDAAPRTVANFAALCTGEKGLGASGKPLHYKGTPFHRVIPGFMIQGGDTTTGDGTGGESIYGERFDDEPFVVPHRTPFLLASANAGSNTNGSQFYITTAPAPHLDGRHVVFGRVLSGSSVVKAIEACGSPSGEVASVVRIVGCGLLPAA